MGVKIIKRRIMESFSISTTKMDSISANDFFSGIKEEIESNLNPDFKYWKIVLNGRDNKRVYIETEPLPIEECGNIMADEIYDTPYSAFSTDEMPCDEASYEILQSDIRKEYDKIRHEIIPKLAKEWGFRKT